MKDHKLESHGKAGFLLANGSGGYLALPNQPECRTNYEGLVLFIPGSWRRYKTVENLYLDIPVDQVENHFHSIIRHSGKVKERFCLVENSVLYEVDNYDGFVNLDLDFREFYDNSDQGRMYQLYKQEDKLIIEYKKYTDNSLKELSHTHYLVIHGAGNFVPVKNWARRDYAYDKRRRAQSVFYIYQALRLRCQGKLRLALTVHSSIETALDQNNVRFQHFDRLLREAEEETEEKYPSARLLPAIHALHSLVKDRDNLLAGLPWFHQFWSRDSLVSLQGFIVQGDFDLVKKILFFYISNIQEDGRLPNLIPSSPPQTCADSVGWLWKRVTDFVLALQERNQLQQVLDQSDLIMLKQKAELCLQRLHRVHMKENMIINNPKETWMDTISRSGVRIEIQALQLSMYRAAQVLNELTVSYSERHALQERQLLQAVRAHFFNGSLADGFVDGKPDFTARPNVFLAYYIYPDLLSKEEWEAVFDDALKKLWLDWGGLATLDKSHPDFKAEHSGQDDLSYHNGDSWYCINNIAAMCLLRLDKAKYKQYIYKIIEASVNEMLYSGWLGHCAEISSAHERSSFGCWAQAWSAATLVELLEEVNRH